MLRAAADRARQSGTDVVAGAAISCECPEARSFEGLWQAENPERLDLDAALRRKPGLLLVENLAYRNQEGRHKKRHQDVEELLNAGIDVFTTLDIPHLESLQDRVAAILGSPVSDPDSRPGVRPGRPGRACGHGPPGTCGNSSAIGTQLPRSPSSAPCGAGLPLCGPYFPRHKGGRQQAEYRAGEHILVCLSSAASMQKIIRTAARMAGAFCCPFTALFVETGDFPRMAAQDRDRLRANIHLAQQLGASIETVYGDDIPRSDRGVCPGVRRDKNCARAQRNCGKDAVSEAPAYGEAHCAFARAGYSYHSGQRGRRRTSALEPAAAAVSAAA